ncbi:MAG: F0F1 ATP synthase subunit gamma [Ginsengibacter sp.]
MESVETLRKKIDGASAIQSVVRTMKTMAAANIGQYETAVSSLRDYYKTIVLGLIAYFREEKIYQLVGEKRNQKKAKKNAAAIVFGSDLGLVGQFNDSLTSFTKRILNDLRGEKVVWAVGERIQLLLSEEGFNSPEVFSIPNSVDAISSLVSQLLIHGQQNIDVGKVDAVYIFHNKPVSPVGYEPSFQQLLPLDENWRQSLGQYSWPGKNLPQVAGRRESTLEALISEFLFVSLYKACAESLATENASRLEAMERAKKNIDDMLEDLNRTYHRLRQETIDEELFDVVSGFEALKNEDE